LILIAGVEVMLAQAEIIWIFHDIVGNMDQDQINCFWTGFTWGFGGAGLLGKIFEKQWKAVIGIIAGTIGLPAATGSCF